MFGFAVGRAEVAPVRATRVQPFAAKFLASKLGTSTAVPGVPEQVRPLATVACCSTLSAGNILTFIFSIP